MELDYIQVDEYAARNNMTAVANTAKEFLNAVANNDTTVTAGASTITENSSFGERFMAICHVLKVNRCLLHLCN